MTLSEAYQAALAGMEKAQALNDATAIGAMGARVVLYRDRLIKGELGATEVSDPLLDVVVMVDAIEKLPPPKTTKQKVRVKVAKKAKK